MSTDQGTPRQGDGRPDDEPRDDSAGAGAEIGIDEDAGTTFEPEEDPEGASDS